jgi:hypothetical protein
VTGYFCDEAHAAEVEAFFAPLVDGLEGGPRNLAGALEEIRLCAALARVQGPALAAYFAERSERLTQASGAGPGRHAERHSASQQARR